MKAKATASKKTKKAIEEDDGKPIVPIPEPPVMNDSIICRDGRKRTTAEALLDGLRTQGFTFRVDGDVLIVSPASKLNQLQRAALKESKEEIKAILAWEAIEPPASDSAMEAWYRTMEKKPGQLPRMNLEALRRLSRNAKQRRIAILSANGEIERVLVNPVDAEAVHGEIQRLAAEHPGRTLAAEWQGPLGWTRWIEITRNEEGGS